MAKVNIEVAYASVTQQKVIPIEIESSATIKDAITQSKILEHFPEIDLQKQKVGVFSKLKSLDDAIKSGDRIEIYRPLTVDPKEARRLRARRKAKSSS